MLYVSNNKLREWAEVERLRSLPELEELLLAGNPLHLEHKDRGTIAEYRIEVCELTNLDWKPSGVEDSGSIAEHKYVSRHECSWESDWPERLEVQEDRSAIS